MSNAGATGGTSTAVEQSPAIELAALDSLPPEVRRAINYSTFKAPPTVVLRVMTERGLSAAQMVEMLRRQDAALSKRYRKAMGLPGAED